MLKSNVPLRINLTKSEKARIDICKESRVFKKYCGFFEQPALLSYEILKLLTEMKDVIFGARSIKSSPALANLLKERKRLPKFMLFSGHAETVTPLLHVFENALVFDVGPGASIFFEYFTVPKT